MQWLLWGMIPAPKCPGPAATAAIGIIASFLFNLQSVKPTFICAWQLTGSLTPNGPAGVICHVFYYFWALIKQGEGTLLNVTTSVSTGTSALASGLV